MNDNVIPNGIRRQSLYLRYYEEYRERRYLADASDEEVMQRARDLMQNIATLGADGKIGATPVDERDGFFLWRLVSHVFEESRLRTGDYRGLFAKYGLGDVHIPKPTYPASPASPQVLKLAADTADQKCIFKFGTQARLQDLLENGRLRVAPASLYNDVSLGHAIQDDELSYDLASPTFEADIKSLDPFKVRLSETFGPLQATRLRATSTTNYYVWCMTCRLDVRLFDDFGADAVLIIREPGIFAEKFLMAIREQLSGWIFAPCAVNYFDPFHPTTDAKSVFRSKHFKYMYQRELRFVFLPPSPILVLEPIFLELGPLSSIASLVNRQDAA